MNILDTIPKDRLITGFVLLSAVLVVGIIDNFYLVWAVLGVVYILAFLEAQKLYGVDDKTLIYFAVLIWVVSAFFSHGDNIFILSGVMYASLVAFNKELKWKNFTPFLYPTAGMLYILTMYQEYGMRSLLWLLVVVALTDVAAYAVGKSIGKTRFSETSPNKTMEGVVGGVLVATIGGMFLGLVIVDLNVAFMVSFMTSISAVFGDLYESSLKRAAGVKDSGSLLPGHGGMLDRIDGYLFGGIVMLVFLRGLV